MDDVICASKTIFMARIVTLLKFKFQLQMSTHETKVEQSYEAEALIQRTLVLYCFSILQTY